MIGAGIFTTSGLLMQDLHNPVVMLALWLIGGLVALCGALSYGELGAAIPHAGGEYAFLSRLYHPILGFLSGWVSFFVGFSAPIAASAIGFSEYLTRAFPGLLHPGLFPGASEATIMKKLYAILIIAAFTFLHTRGLEAGARVQNALTGLKILLIVGLVAAGFAFGKGSLAHLTAAAPFRFDFTGIKTMGLSLMWIMFAYSGWNASAYVGSEVRDPRATCRARSSSGRRWSWSSTPPSISSTSTPSRRPRWKASSRSPGWPRETSSASPPKRSSPS